MSCIRTHRSRSWKSGKQGSLVLGLALAGVGASGDARAQARTAGPPITTQQNYGTPTTFDPSALEPQSTDSPAPKALPGGGYWMPGQPMPITGQNSPNNPIDPSTGALRPTGPVQSGRGTGEAVIRPEDYQAVLRSDRGGTPGGIQTGGAPGDVPEVHRVIKGDTLWDLSSAYFRDPYYWPKLWAQNPSITNPHWIFPGDLVRLRSPMGAALPASVGPASSAPVVPPAPEGVQLRQSGFVEAGEVKGVGRITGSRAEVVMLSYLDEAYLAFEKDAHPKVGDRYTIYKVLKSVKRPGTGTVLGSIVMIAGEIEVRSVDIKGMSRGVIVEAMQPIERDYRIGPLRRKFEVLEPVGDTVDLDAYVLATLRQEDLLGTYSVVFLDRGREDGLVPGNRLMAAHRGDGIPPKMKFRAAEDKHFPRELIGEVLLLEVRSKTSTGVVLRTTRELEIADKLEARKGY